MTERSHISSTSTADTWDHGVVAGTGVAGAVVYGGPARHRIVFSHERFLLPANSRRAAPDLAPVLPQLRAALAEGDSAAAADLVELRMRELGLDPGELVWTDPLVPIGEIVWEPDDGGPADGYRRRIPLQSGGVTVSWIRAGTAMSLSVIAERGRSEFVIEVASDGPLAGRLSVGAVHETRVGASNVGADDYSRFVRTTLERAGLRITAPGREVADKVEAMLTVTPLDDASVTATDPGIGFDGWRVELPHGGTARLCVSLTVSGGTDHGGADDGEFGEMLARSVLDLQSGSTDATVEELWTQARHGDPLAEHAVFEVAYAAGRRNIIASTGVLPPTLQGVWAGTWAPAWSADYTLNGNVQNGTLADVLWTGTPELMRSLFRLVTPFREHFRSNARNIFGLDGMLLPARMTTHGHANHFTRDFPHQYWVGNGPWLTRLLADYVMVTGDAAAVDEAMWEIVREVLGFSLDLLADAAGQLSPSFSPENTPAGSGAPLATDATMDIGAIRDALHAGAFLADLRGESDIGAAWREDAQNVGGFEVASDGTLSEWSGRWAEQLEHRHTSQLYPLWYVLDPAFEDDALREAARTTVRAKIAWRAEDPTPPPGRMEMAFGLAQLGLAAATLGDADAAYQCAIWLARDHFRPSLVSTHDAGEIFNLDASGALPAVVAAMLLGSAPGELRLFPALPAQWAAGRITGLTARGGWIVDELDWSHERIRLRAHARPGTAWLRTTGTIIRAAAKTGRGLDVIASIPADQEAIALDYAWRAQTESR